MSSAIKSVCDLWRGWVERNCRKCNLRMMTRDGLCIRCKPRAEICEHQAARVVAQQIFEPSRQRIERMCAEFRAAREHAPAQPFWIEDGDDE